MSMSVLAVLRREDASRREKILAVANIVGFVYFLLLTCIVTYLCMFEIVPLSYGESDTALYHLAAILYLFLNVAGNFANVIRVHSRVDILQNIAKDKEFRLECSRCNRGVPRRTHHCSLCNVCVLKRDHHCFFMCTCIGYFNQKYFIMFTMYMTVAGAYAATLLATYLQILYQVQHHSVLSVFTVGPLAFTTWWTSGTLIPPIHKFFLLGTFYASFIACLVASSFFLWEIYLTFHGQTSHEAKTGVTKYCRTAKENFLDVFGPYWFITLFLPIPLPQLSDGTYKRRVTGRNWRKSATKKELTKRKAS